MRKLRDYVCRECGLQFEKLLEDLDKAECPRCGGIDTKSILSPNAIKVGGIGAVDTRMKL